MCVTLHTNTHMPVPYNPTQKDGRSVAATNDLKILQALRLFGHLRRQEIAIGCWPNSSPQSAYIMACRTVMRMVDAGLILNRPNSLGGNSLVLASKGVAALRLQDLNSQEGYDVSVDGANFLHRTLGNTYMLDKARTGCEVFGEYAILKGFAPVQREFVRAKFNKIPDGLIVYSSKTLGFKEGLRGADWVEVEQGFKSYDELRKSLMLLTRNTELNQHGDVTLHKLVFVYDGRHKHERNILRAIKQFLKEKPDLSREMFLEEIVLAKCFVEPPFVWHGVVETTAAQLMRVPGNRFDELDPLPGTDA